METAWTERGVISRIQERWIRIQKTKKRFHKSRRLQVKRRGLEWKKGTHSCNGWKKWCSDAAAHCWTRGTPPVHHHRTTTAWCQGSCEHVWSSTTLLARTIVLHVLLLDYLCPRPVKALPKSARNPSWIAERLVEIRTRVWIATEIETAIPIWRGSNHPETLTMIRKIKETSKICCNLPLPIGKLWSTKITRSLVAHSWYSLLRIMSPARNEEKKNYNARRANVISVFYKTSNEDSCACVP
jgi:hypothetical protein